MVGLDVPSTRVLFLLLLAACTPSSATLPDGRIGAPDAGDVVIDAPASTVDAGAPDAAGPLVGWQQLQARDAPAPRDLVSVAYDATNGELVMFGGVGYYGEPPPGTWAWDGTTWRHAQPSTPPLNSQSTCMAFDGTRVLFYRGFDFTAGPEPLVDTTYAWDGTEWTSLMPPTSPPPRYEAACAFDAARGRWVLFGGYDTVGQLADTWEFDGTTWVDVTPASSPGGRNAWMAYDPVRQAVVLYGGVRYFPAYATLADTWLWDGASWIDANPATLPPARAAATLAFDDASGDMLLIGASDLWRWDGLTWADASPATVPPVGTATYDPDQAQVVMMGGGARAELWGWDGAAWTVAYEPTGPTYDVGPAVFDAARGQLMVLGGFHNLQGPFRTWLWDGTAWSRPSPATSPSARGGAALTYDVGRERVVMFGGRSIPGSVLLTDTWEWDGTTWSDVTPATPSPTSEACSLAYDAAQARSLMTCWTYDVSYHGETWSWDGVAWSPHVAANPLPLPGLGLVYDATRAQVVHVASDFSVWAWDGSDWTQVVPVATPPARYGASVVFAPSRGQVMLFGGTSSADNTTLNDTWSWDGVTWSEVVLPNAPTNYWHASSAVDPATGHVLIVGSDGLWALGIPPLVP